MGSSSPNRDEHKKMFELPPASIHFFFRAPGPPRGGPPQDFPLNTFRPIQLKATMRRYRSPLPSPENGGVQVVETGLSLTYFIGTGRLVCFIRVKHHVILYKTRIEKRGPRLEAAKKICILGRPNCCRRNPKPLQV